MKKSGWERHAVQMGVMLAACLAGSLAVSGIVYAADARCRALGFVTAMRTVYFWAAGLSLLLAAALLLRRHDRFVARRDHEKNALPGMKPGRALPVISAFFIVGAVALDLYVA